MGRAGYQWWNARSVSPSRRKCEVAKRCCLLPEVALERDIEGDLFLADIGQGIPFRAGSFDGAISCVQTYSSGGRTLTQRTCSVSVLQWLCNADATAHSPPQRLLRFFTDLFGVLTRGSRAVFQFYPESDEQVKFIMNFATKAGFGGGLCVDYVCCLSSHILTFERL